MTGATNDPAEAPRWNPPVVADSNAFGVPEALRVLFGAPRSCNIRSVSFRMSRCSLSIRCSTVKRLRNASVKFGVLLALYCVTAVIPLVMLGVGLKGCACTGASVKASKSAFSSCHCFCRTVNWPATMSANALMASTIGCDTTKGSLSSGGSLSAITGVVFGETSAADSVRPTSSSSSSSPSMIVLGASSTSAMKPRLLEPPPALPTDRPLLLLLNFSLSIRDLAMENLTSLSFWIW
mmetsp:Transcript_12462/g.20455  ORF Transcript_12462/g.20455 Transcript_12462/m.20455 type:complete len:237 (-) Transcript_12462:289-999(-)